MHKDGCTCAMCRATQHVPSHRREEFIQWQAVFDRMMEQDRAHQRQLAMIQRQQAMRTAMPPLVAPALTREMLGEPYAAPARPALPTADTMGPIRAWRLWEIENERLWSVSRRVEWKPGVPMQGAPRPDNDAGVYAVKDKAHKFAYSGDTVLGEVGLWGRVIEHALGFRAEYAYPIQLVHRPPSPMPGFPRPTAALRRLQAIADAYGIPLTVEETPC